MRTRTEFFENEMKQFEPSAKIGLVATVDPAGKPHISLLTSIQANTPTEMIVGEFSKGLSKRNMRENPKVGFLIMNVARQLWRGRALWKQARTEGPEYEMYNDKPMYRYNSYFGINTVHYLDLVEAGFQESLPLHSIVPASILTKLVKNRFKTTDGDPILNSWSKALFDRMDTLKFVATIDERGFPVITPLLQCQAADQRRLAFSTLAYRQELNALKPGDTLAVFGLTMAMENVLVRGTFNGFRRVFGLRAGSLDVDWVYNSMPPNHGVIYPREPLQAVTEF